MGLNPITPYQTSKQVSFIRMGTGIFLLSNGFESDNYIKPVNKSDLPRSEQESQYFQMVLDPIIISNQ
jgi:hypothetical protein